jgi:tetratricopeptide (TPR) repeat protein
MPSSEQKPPSAFSRLPPPLWIGLLAFFVYGLTLNHWVSLSNVGAVARVSGWTWQPELRQPLTCLFLFPFHILPSAWLPFALNLFATVCATFVVSLLARSVWLLSGAVRTPRPTSASWAPACIAVAVCGLQLTFWEHATSFSGEMLDLLIFAYVIRCLVEFRADQRETWLCRSAVIYGAGMTNNWALVGYLPLYVIAILFIKDFGLKRVTKPSRPRMPRQLPRWLRQALAKMGFAQNAMPKPVYAPFRPVVFDTAFFVRMGLWGLAGLSLYFLLPLVLSLSPHASIGFWPALKANLRSQWGFLTVMRSPAFRLLALASLLPLLVLVLGWKSKPANAGYETRRAIFLNRLASYPLHIFVLLIALWLSFDPTFSPRHLSVGVPMLSYYYLSAIVAGYCAAYVLDLAAESASKFVATFVTVSICTLAVALPLLLTARNLDYISLTNGPSLHRFAEDMYADLPSGKSVVLGTDFLQLSLLRAELSAQGHDKDALIVELPSLSSAQYHQFMSRQYGGRWPIIPPTNSVDLIGPIKILKLASAFAEHESVYYLDPTFGPLFERPNDSVNGFIHHFATDPEAQTLTSEVTWQQRWSNHVQALAARVKTQSASNPTRFRPMLNGLRLRMELSTTPAFLQSAYSKSLNNWGVQSQRLGHWAEAGVWFRRSLELNPGNLSAHINSEFNEQRQIGQKTRLNPAALQKQYADVFSRYNDWREILGNFGPVDEPTFLFRTGRAFLANGNVRLAANAFKRSADLARDWPQPKLWLAQSLNEDGEYAEALNVTEHLANGLPDEGIIRAQFLRCRASSLRGAGRTNEIPPFIDGFVRENGRHREVLAAAASACSESGMHDQQLAMIEELLKREPNRSEWLSQKGLAELQLGRYDNAISSLTTALSFAPTDENARLSRAIARLGADQLDAARDDYQQLLNSKTCSDNAVFGLGTIAWRKHETNTAVALYQQYLTNATSSSLQATVAAERLREMSAR